MKENTQTSNSAEFKSSLVSRNITIFGRRTSVRLEPQMWNALKDIARRENCSIHDICSLIDYRKQDGTSLTAAIRVFLMLYFKASSTEEGHEQAGHGSFENMKLRAGLVPKLNSMNSSNGVSMPSSNPGANEHSNSTQYAS